MNKILLSVLLIFSGAACSQKNFALDESASLSAAGSPNGALCTDTLQSVSVPVKVVLSVDMSGSNLPHEDMEGISRPGNDIDKSRRGGAIQNFFNAYANRSNFSWSFLTFQHESSSSLIPASMNSGLFTSSPAQMQSAINLFYSRVDRLGTPYMAALLKIAQAIAEDPTATEDTKYIVVFVSDGKPDPAVATSDLIMAIQSILQLAPGQVTFSTIYYGLPNAETTARLATMASAGGGAFLDASNGQVPSIEDVATVSGSSCP